MSQSEREARLEYFKEATKKIVDTLTEVHNMDGVIVSPPGPHITVGDLKDDMLLVSFSFVLEPEPTSVQRPPRDPGNPTTFTEGGGD